MAIPNRKFTVGSNNKTSDYDGKDVVFHTNDTRCSQGISVLNPDLPQKFRSPPPKPPRRRHSDQTAVTSSGSFALNRRKYVDRNPTSIHNETSIKTANCSSGCESLPANWIAGFLDNQAIAETTVLKNSELCLSPKLKGTFTKESPSEKCNIPVKYFPSPNKSIDPTQKESLVFACQSSFDQSFSLHTFAPANSNLNCHMLHIPNSSLQCHMKKKICHLSNSQHQAISFDNNVLRLVECPKFIHRRHHSDPLLSRFNRSFRTVAKICSKRSHSFMEHTSTWLKDSKCTQYLNMPKDTQIASAEVKFLKEMNDKLWQHLCSTQAKLDNFQRSQLSLKTHIVGAPSYSDLMFDIYYAQKEKDHAMENRLKAALEERDAAVGELEEMVQALTRSFEDGDAIDDENEIFDKELKQLLQEIETTQNPTKLLQQQRILLAYLYRCKEAKQHRLSHELRLSLIERDNAIDKAKKLEKELTKWKSTNNVYENDVRQWETSLLDGLCKVISQRDSALSQVEALQKEVESLHVYYSSHKLQKSLSGDGQANSDYESLQKFELVPTRLEDAGSIVKHEPVSPSLDERKSFTYRGATSDEVKRLTSETSNLTKKLEDELKNRQIAEEKCYRLERLVNVLRKKIHGLNVGIPV